MNTKHFFTLIVLLYSCTGCFDELQKPDKLWIVNINSTDPNVPWLFLDILPYYDGKILLQAKGYKTSIIRAVNAQTGDTEWEWNDYIEGDAGAGSVPIVTYKNYCHFSNVSYVYVIDMNTGKTFWKDKIPDDVRGSFGYPGDVTIDNKVYLSFGRFDGYEAYDPDPRTPMTLEIDKQNSVSYSLYNEKGEVEYPLNLYSFVPYKNTAGEICLLFPYNKPKDNTRDQFGKYLNLQHFLASYNTIQKKYEYRDSTKDIFFGTSMVFENKIYGNYGYFNAQKEEWQPTIFRYDPITKIKNWESDAGNVGGLDMTIFDRKLIAPGSEYLVCFNIDTGEKLWELHEGGGNAQSPFVYLNNIVYWTNAGYLFAVELNTGKILLGESRKGHIEQHGSYDLTIGLIPPQNGGKGKIVVHDYENAYCFEALR